MITSHAIEAQRQPYRRFRENRNSGRNRHFDPEKGLPGPRYMALNTLSHLLIRRIAIECGYSSASLGERIYTGGLRCRQLLCGLRWWRRVKQPAPWFGLALLLPAEPLHPAKRRQLRLSTAFPLLSWRHRLKEERR